MTGSYSNAQRKTTPLRRDNSLIQSERAPGPDEEKTRPAFAPPDTQQSPGTRQFQSPGTRQFDAVPAQPPPRQETPPGFAGGSGTGPGKLSPTGWLLRGLGLVAISVVSGLLWLAIKPAPEEPPEEPGQPELKYTFNQVMRVEGGVQGCQRLSSDKIAEYFEEHECEHLSRALYSTLTPTGERVLTSVITVLMPDEQSAQQLNQLATQDNTGNVRDLVDDNNLGTEGLPRLNDKAYASDQQGRLVVIGDSAYYDKKTPEKDPQLVDITKEALKLGWPQERDQLPPR